MQKTTTSSCFLCSTPSVQICGFCKEVFVCEDHSEYHHPKEQDICLPYKVSVDDVKGRILLASRDITEDEIVIVDKAAVYGPNMNPVCLGCLKTVPWTRGKNKELNYGVCSKCYFPSCGSKECRSDASLHVKYECPIFSATGFKPKFTDLESPHFIYNVITILRLILAKRENKSTSALVDCLMTHHEDRVATYPEVNVGIQKIFRFFKEDLKIPELEEKDVIDSFGVLKTNAMTFGDGRGRGLYPVGSIISHSCVSNLEPLGDPKESLVLRSKTAIPRGNELTIRYMSFWSHRITLRDDLRSQWFFNCECKRCQDPTDLGTNLSSELCESCDSKSFICPISPLDPESDWACESCQTIRSKKDILNGLQRFPEPDVLKSIQEIMFFIKKSESLYHPNHFLTLNYKYSLAKWVTLKELKEMEFVKLALKYYDTILGITDVLDPGVTKDKGRILLETAKLKLLILQHLQSKGNINKDVFDRQHKIIMALENKGKLYFNK